MERRLLLSGTNSVPQFNHGTLGWSVPVDSPIETVLGQLTAYDSDGDTLTFSSDQLFGGPFVVDSAGVISLSDPAQLELMGVGSSIQFGVWVTDGTDTSETSVTMTVTALSGSSSNTAPVFDSSQSSFTIELDATDGTIGTVAASDADGDALSFSGFDFQYGLVEVTDDGSLVLDADRLVNVEAGQAINLTAYVSDGLQHVQMPITLNIAPSQAELNNTAPTFSSSQFSFDVPQDAAVGTIVGTIDATDSEQQSLIFHLADPDAQSTLAVDSLGNVYVASQDLASASVGDVINFDATVEDPFAESQASVSVNVVAGDGSGGSAELPIVFQQGAYGFSVPKDIARGSVLGELKATDDDGLPLTFGGANDFISVQPDGRIVVHNTLHLKQRDDGATEEVTVTVTNGSQVATADLFLTVLPEGNLQLNNEFISATNEMAFETDYDALIADLPFISRVESFAGNLATAIDDAGQASSSAQSPYDDDAWQFGSPEEGPGRPSAYRFLPETDPLTNLDLPLNQATDPTTTALTGTDSFQQSSTSQFYRSHDDAIVAEAFPELTSTATVTQTIEQDYVSPTEYVVTQSVSSTYKDQVPSGHSDAGQSTGGDADGALTDDENFERTVTETLTVTVANGLTTTWSYTLTTPIGYTVGELEGVTDQDSDSPLQIPDDWRSAVGEATQGVADRLEEEGDDEGGDGQEGTPSGEGDGDNSNEFWGTLFGDDGDSSSSGTGSSEGNGSNGDGSMSEGSSADEPVVESSSKFGAAFQASSTISVTLVETKIPQPDGSFDFAYNLSFGIGMGATSIAAGQSSFSSEQGELEGAEGDETTGGDGGDPGDGSSGGSGSGGGSTGPGTFGGGPGVGTGGGGADGGNSSGSGGATGSDDDQLPDELNTSDIDGTGDGHSISANSQFIGYQSANTGMNVGIGLTVSGGQPSDPSLSFGTSLSTNSGGMDSASIGVDLQTPTPDGFQYISFGAGGGSGGDSTFGFSHSFADGEEGEGPDVDLSLDVGSSGFEEGGGNVKVISSKDYTEADGDEITELQVVFSSGSESALAEHGLDEGTITDFAKVSSDGLTHFLNVSTYRGYSDTDDGPVLTHTRDNQSVLSATYDFSGSIDEGGSPFDVLLGLTGDPAGEGENEIDFKSMAHEVIENLPDLPGVRMEDTYTVTIDATVTVTVDESGISGTVSGTKTSIGLTVVEGIFHSGVSMDPDGNQTGRWDNLPVGTTHYGDGTVSLDDTFGVTVRSKEQILADLREAVATKLRIEDIMAHHPHVGANLASQLTDIETSIADLEAATAEAGATSDEIAAAKSAGAADAAGFNRFLYVMRVYLIRGEGIEADPFFDGSWFDFGEFGGTLAGEFGAIVDGFVGIYHSSFGDQGAANDAFAAAYENGPLGTSVEGPWWSYYGTRGSLGVATAAVSTAAVVMGVEAATGTRLLVESSGFLNVLRFRIGSGGIFQIRPSGGAPIFRLDFHKLPSSNFRLPHLDFNKANIKHFPWDQISKIARRLTPKK